MTSFNAFRFIIGTAIRLNYNTGISLTFTPRGVGGGGAIGSVCLYVFLLSICLSPQKWGFLALYPVKSLLDPTETLKEKKNERMRT